MQSYSLVFGFPLPSSKPFGFRFVYSITSLNRKKTISTKKILVWFEHPAFQKSRIYKILIQGIDAMEGVTFHDIYQAYPEMDIEVKPEQQLVDEHDVIIFHHHFYWYCAPAMLREWQDLVLQHGWAYGSEGEALKDKLFLQVDVTR